MGQNWIVPYNVLKDFNICLEKKALVELCYCHCCNQLYIDTNKLSKFRLIFFEVPDYFLSISKLPRIRCMAVQRPSPICHATDPWQIGDLLQSAMQRIRGRLETFSKLPCNGSMGVWRPTPNCHATNPWEFGDLLQTTMQRIRGRLETCSKVPCKGSVAVWRRSPIYHGSVAWHFGAGLQSTTDPLHGSLEIGLQTAMQHIYYIKGINNI